MPWRRPTRLQHIAGIAVDRMGSLADESGRDFLLENLDTDIPPRLDDTHDRDHARIECRFSVSASGFSVGTAREYYSQPPGMGAL